MLGHSHLLFVYGSLKQGYANSFRMGQSRLLRTARSGSGFRLFDYGGYPALVPEDGPEARSILGEIWEVSASQLESLDVFEGISSGLYRRGPIEMKDGTEGVEAYFYARTLQGLPDCGDRWLEDHDYWLEGWRF